MRETFRKCSLNSCFRIYTTSQYITQIEAKSQYICIFSSEKHALIELPNMLSYVQGILQSYEGSNFLYQVYLIRVVVRNGGR